MQALAGARSANCAQYPRATRTPLPRYSYFISSHEPHVVRARNVSLSGSQPVPFIRQMQLFYMFIGLWPKCCRRRRPRRFCKARSGPAGPCAAGRRCRRSGRRAERRRHTADAGLHAQAPGACLGPARLSCGCGGCGEPGQKCLGCWGQRRGGGALAGAEEAEDRYACEPLVLTLCCSECFMAWQAHYTPWRSLETK